MSSGEEEKALLRSRIGRQRWKGDELELKRDQPSDKAAAAVDLNQFRNFQVGQGYQAKHVVRQRTTERQMAPISDMSKPANEHGESSKKRKAAPDSTKPRKMGKLERFLSCEGFRKFRKEIETIISS